MHTFQFTQKKLSETNHRNYAVEIGMNFNGPKFTSFGFSRFAKITAIEPVSNEIAISVR